MQACQRRYIGIVSFLLNYAINNKIDIDVDKVFPDGKNVLTIVNENDYIEVYELLIHHGAKL